MQSESHVLLSLVVLSDTRHTADEVPGETCGCVRIPWRLRCPASRVLMRTIRRLDMQVAGRLHASRSPIAVDLLRVGEPVPVFGCAWCYVRRGPSAVLPRVRTSVLSSRMSNSDTVASYRVQLELQRIGILYYSSSTVSSTVHYKWMLILSLGANGVCRWGLTNGSNRKHASESREREYRQVDNLRI